MFRNILLFVAASNKRITVLLMQREKNSNELIQPQVLTAC